MRHARHGAGAQRLNAGLLHGFKHGAGVLSLGPVFAVNLVRVIGEPEGEAVGEAAGDGDVLGRELTGDLRKLGLVAGKRRRFIAEAHGEFRIVGNGFHRQRQDALEFLCSAFAGLCHWLHVPSGNGHMGR